MKYYFCRLALVSLVVLLAPAASAVPAGNEVVVLYNTKVPESKDVARHYAEVRQVPKNQVFGFDLSANEEISRAEYDHSLAQPLAHELEARELWRIGATRVAFTNATDVREIRMPVESKIRYLVLCYGVPMKIKSDPDLREPNELNIRPELRRNEASVDSELAALPLPVEIHMAFGPLRNPAYTTTNAAMLHPTNGILLVARLDGPTAEIARSLVDKAVEAETNGYWGRAYCDIRSIADPGYKPGDDWIRAASEICHVMGFDSCLDTNEATISDSFPMSQIGFYAGWYDGGVSGPFLASRMEFMPGAFAYHLHSGSASTVRSASQNWVGPLLAKGATCTMGSVYEPYLLGTPDIGTFTARWLINNFTFGEAAWAAQSGLSWQTTVVGDPLHRAFPLNPQFLQLRLKHTKNPLLAWSHLRLVNLALVQGTPKMQMVAYLEGLDLTKQSAVLMEKQAELYAAVGKPSSTVYAYRQALKLDPTPQQRIRLYLKLGGHFTVQNRDEEALANWLALLREFPAYPGKQDIISLCLALDRKLGKLADSAKGEAEFQPTVPGSALTNAATK